MISISMPIITRCHRNCVSMHECFAQNASSPSIQTTKVENENRYHCQTITNKLVWYADRSIEPTALVYRTSSINTDVIPYTMDHFFSHPCVSGCVCSVFRKLNGFCSGGAEKRKKKLLFWFCCCVLSNVQYQPIHCHSNVTTNMTHTHTSSRMQNPLNWNSKRQYILVVCWWLFWWVRMCQNCLNIVK